MDALGELIIKLLTDGGRDALMLLGWVLFLYEHYIVFPRRERDFRDDVSGFREDYQELTTKISDTLSSFHTILEVIKDRIGRP